MQDPIIIGYSIVAMRNNRFRGKCLIGYLLSPLSTYLNEES